MSGLTEATVAAPADSAPESLARVRATLGLSPDGSDGPPDLLPFGTDDTTAGVENELLTLVIGPRDGVELVRTITESNYYRNLLRRMEAGDTSRSAVRELREFLSDNREQVWENSWVCFPAALLTPYARQVLEDDLYSDKRARTARRADADRFVVRRDGAEFLRLPVSYLLKLALADVVGHADDAPAIVRRTGERLMRHFLNDNTSPETYSFHLARSGRGGTLGRELAEETLRRFLLVQFLTMYANEKFELRARGQEMLICFAPQTPLRQKRLNELVSDSFYRDLFMSPCLSGWDHGEAKHQYMILCHEVLSRSRLNTIGKLRECGILARNLVTLPTVSNTSLANNGTHISLGSRRLSALRAAGDAGFGAGDEKRIGDLVVKIVEHFLPLFVGTYSAAPYRIDFQDFHPETVLGFLPHELDFTHLRMVWRRWKGKADLRIHRWGYSLTPFGPRALDRFLGRALRLRGDYMPDQRLIDYLVCPLSTEHSPALDGTEDNDVRLRRDLTEMGVFDARMSLYSLYRQRLFARNAFCGFEGRTYSQFSCMLGDMADAANLQWLVTALAYRYALTGAVRHADIPDRPDVESERRQIFFGAAIGIPTFFAAQRTENRLLKRILALASRTRASHRYPGHQRIHNIEYRRALVRLLEHDAADLIEAFGLEATMTDLKQRLEPDTGRTAEAALLKGILEEAGERTPLRTNAAEFNAAAERYYRGGLLRRFEDEALGLLENDLRELDAHAASQHDEYAGALHDLLGGETVGSFFQAVRGSVLQRRVSQSALVKLIGLTLLIISLRLRREGGAE